MNVVGTSHRSHRWFPEVRDDKDNNANTYKFPDWKLETSPVWRLDDKKQFEMWQAQPTDTEKGSKRTGMKRSRSAGKRHQHFHIANWVFTVRQRNLSGQVLS